MFDLLRKKISGFTQKIIGNAEANQTLAPTAKETSSAPLEKAPHQIEHPFEEKNNSPADEETAYADTITHEAESEDEPEEHQPAEETINPVSHPAPAAPLPEIKQRDEREIKTNIGLFQKIGSVFTGTITLNENTVNTFLDEFEFSLLEADVEISTTQALIEEMRKRLSNKVISSREDPAQAILHEIKGALQEIIDVQPFDLDRTLSEKKPGIVLILGPNGAGKTTTIAKLTHRFQKMGKKIVLASADTFRAGSIEQLQTHADKLGVRLVKHQYGADPAAVAYDAVSAARAENADIVLIDTAGRQDTNKNLLEELKKIQRVIQPHAKIYVGESYTGQAILTQAETFNEAIGIDGFILTKLDTDTKGGGVISILHNVKKPILFFGVGQTYEDLIPFDLEDFLERLIPEKNE